MPDAGAACQSIQHHGDDINAEGGAGRGETVEPGAGGVAKMASFGRRDGILRPAVAIAGPRLDLNEDYLTPVAGDDVEVSRVRPGRAPAPRQDLKTERLQVPLGYLLAQQA